MLESLLSFVPTFVLVVFRLAGMILYAPLFGSVRVPRQVRVMLILVLAAEINVVQDFCLWPRSLLTPFTDDVVLTAADRRVYSMYAAAQRFKGFQHVTTDFGDGADGSAPGAGAPTQGDEVTRRE